MRGITRVIQAVHDLPQPTIAKVTGVAAGVGCSLALGCDLIVASEEARFSMIFAKRGLSLDGGASWLLPRLVGMHRAKELALFADVISAQEAHDMGLVNRLLPADQVDKLVDEWSARLASGPPITYALTKKLLNR
jgi:2-(1,2-epoxy-1,2-dihydrophenyl)acetyl-CoA isomerase